MPFEGYEEIARYIQQERRPSFKKFVEGNVVNLANWSLKLPTISTSTIHGFWFEKYCKVSMDIFKTRPRKPNAYNVMIWSDILSRVNRRKNMLDKCGEAALDVIGDVSGSVASQVSKSIVYSGGSSSLCSPDDSTNDHNAPDDTSDASVHHHNTNHNLNTPDNTSYASIHDHDSDHNSDATGSTSGNSIEYRDLHYYGVKKLRGTFDEQDKCNVENKLTNGSNSDEKITNHIIKLLCQPNLTPTDQETIKLLLSKIINTLDENIYATMGNIFTSEQLNILCSDDTKSEQLFGLDFVNLALLDKIIDSSNNVASFLRQVYLEKLTFIDSNDFNSDGYRMLCILGIVGEGFTMPIDDKASETTFYRRFSILLDYVFSGTDIKMHDGEVVAEATRMAMGQNDYDTTSWFGRKIDLLLKLKDTSIELASNEWKSSKTDNLKLKQQSKNLRCNSAILKKLRIESGTRINTVMAADVIGTTGYLYKLQWKHGIYVATMVEAIFLPATVYELKLFKNTIKTLFFWKDFLVGQGEVMSQIALQAKLDTIARRPASSATSTISSTSSLPLVFFTPSNSHQQKRKISSMS